MLKSVNHLICIFLFGGYLMGFLNSVTAQVPENFNWQGVIRDGNGEILQNSDVTIRFQIEYEIFQNMLAPVYVEDHEVITNEFGLVNLQIGTGTEVVGDFELVDWRSDYIMTVKVDIGNGFTEVHSDYFSSVPFAMRARDNWALDGNTGTNPGEDYIGTGDNKDLHIATRDTTRMIIAANGNVGIGVETPLDELHISDSTLCRIRLTTEYFGPPSTSTGLVLERGVNISRILSLSGPLILSTSSISSTVMLEGGNVGIGTPTGPDVRLHVDGGTDASVADDYSGFFLLGDIDASNMVLDQNEILARNNGGTNTLFLNTSGGAVVINQNTTPGFDFAVNGSAAKPGGGSWSALSDARMKENVSPFMSGLNLIRNVNPVTFHYNPRSGHDTSKEHVGVIAQELQEVAPFMVEEKTMEFEDGNKEDYLTVDPSAFMYLLINATKELEDLVNKQQAQIDQLRKQLEDLQSSDSK